MQIYRLAAIFDTRPIKGRAMKGLPCSATISKVEKSSFPARAVRWTCYPPQGDRREGARKRQLLLHTQRLLCLPTETREKPPDWCLLPWASVSARACAFLKEDREQQGQGQALTTMLPLGGVSCYAHHWEPSITLGPARRSPKRNLAKVEPGSL